MVVWPTPAIRQGDPEQLIVYLEGDARIEWPYHHQSQHTLLIRLESRPGMSVVGRPAVQDVSGADDPVFQRATAVRSDSRPGTCGRRN